MSDMSVSVSQQVSEVNALNAKLGYDSAAQLQHQSLVDNQEDARAWAALKLRTAHNAATVDHLADVAALSSDQTGQTENEQTVSPVRTGTGDAIVGTVGVSSDAIAASLGNLATSLVPVIASAVATATSQTLTAVLPVLLQAIGNASKPTPTA